MNEVRRRGPIARVIVGVWEGLDEGVPVAVCEPVELGVAVAVRVWVTVRVLVAVWVGKVGVMVGVGS